MEKNLHTCTITILDRDASYLKVSKILHKFADDIRLRVGYPVEHKNLAIIFLIMEITNDQAGALAGEIGQIDSVKIKINLVKM